VSRDEILFPLTGHRLSFVSSPESDYDIAGNRPGNIPRDQEHGAPPPSWNKLPRASSDPSIATMENPGGEAFPGLTGAVSGVDVSNYGHDGRHVSSSVTAPCFRHVILLNKHKMRQICTDHLILFCHVTLKFLGTICLVNVARL